jgi:hypothetical protein
MKTLLDSRLTYQEHVLIICKSMRQHDFKTTNQSKPNTARRDLLQMLIKGYTRVAFGSGRRSPAAEAGHQPCRDEAGELSFFLHTHTRIHIHESIMAAHGETASSGIWLIDQPC